MLSMPSSSPCRTALLAEQLSQPSKCQVRRVCRGAELDSLAEVPRFDLSGKCRTEGSEEDFEEKRRTYVLSKLHSILRPFLLRRLKADVEQMLPRKKEIIIYATITEHQRNFQQHLVDKTLEGHLLQNSVSGRAVEKGKLNNLMIQLRKNCNHPDLLESAFDGSYFYPPVEQIVGHCGKFRLLEILLNKLLDRKHKVLIFSQWTKILDIMEYYLSEKGFEVCRIDGNVKLDARRKQRCHKASSYYKRLIRGSIVAQTRWRGRIAKKELRKLKMVGSIT